jgi:hypothetical protein
VVVSVNSKKQSYFNVHNNSGHCSEVHAAKCDKTANSDQSNVHQWQ